MKAIRIFLIAVVCGLLLSPCTTFGQEWTVKLRIYENNVLKDSLEFGISYSATDNIDWNLGEAELPPLAPYGTLDIRFTGENIGLGLKRDLRESTEGEKQFTIVIRRSLSNSTISLKWDSLPDGEFNIQDKYGGVLIDQDMRTTNLLEISNSNISGLKLFVTPVISDISTGIEEDRTLVPNKFSLGQNYPNPFNPVTTIRYQLPQASHVKLVVYNILGREVDRLVDTYVQAGFHTIKWDASRFANGTYIYRITAGSFTEIRRMVLVK